MNSLEIVATLAPWAFFLASLIFIIIAALHIKHLRQKDMEEQIALQESQINEKYNHYGDTDVLNELNELESRPGGPITPKE